MFFCKPSGHCLPSLCFKNETNMLLIGITLIILGVLSLFDFAALKFVTYPLLWWGLILALDEVNFKKWSGSPIRSHGSKFFIAIIVPISVMYWLFFEFINFAFPQWYYINVIQQPLMATLLTFLSFATVIPAVVECVWLVAGKIPSFKISGGWAYVSIVAGILFAVPPFFFENFWLNQLVWISPFLMLAPFLENEKLNLKSLISVGLAGLLTGFLWELLNSGATTKWQYGILSGQPHLFEMPLPGYFGFIPFAFSAIAVYLFSIKFLKTGIVPALTLYAAAILLSYIFAIKLI